MGQLAKHDQSLELAHVFFAAKRTGFVPVLYQFRTTRHKRNANVNRRRRSRERFPSCRSFCRRKYALRKAVCRLTGHMKTLKNAHNTGFLRMARPGSAGRVVSVWGEKVGRAAPALCLSLLNSPLVNRVLTAAPQSIPESGGVAFP